MPLFDSAFIYTCGNCGFKGNSHEMEVHAATAHYPCSDPGCELCHDTEFTPVHHPEEK